MKILYISNFDLPDFMNDMVFHGVRSLFGEDVVDSREAWYMYDDFRNCWADRIPSKGMEYGRGFTLYGRLPKLTVDRTDLESKIKNHYFDKIIYGSIKRNQDFLNIVKLHYKPVDVILIDGEDTFNLWIMPEGTYYKRELIEQNLQFGARPINFCIPKELITSSVPTKTQDWGKVMPDDKSTYIFTEEKPYFEDYQHSYFGVTGKKGGWDCLRHYEILMNGCIPFFQDIEKCPSTTMTRFPKELVVDACNRVIQGQDLSFYEERVAQLLDWTRKYLTTEEVAKYILNT